MHTLDLGGHNPSPQHYETARAFMSRVVVAGDCWLWQGEVDRIGYGWARDGGKRVGAHVLSHRLFIGPVGDGLEVDHVRARGCTHRHCVNPAHLEAVTHEENMRRMRHPWPHEPSALTHCTNGHEYTDENTYVRGDGAKYCRECARIGNAVRRENRRAATTTDVRPSLDALAQAICADVGNRSRLGRPLPLPSTSKARADELIGAAFGLVRGAR